MAQLATVFTIRKVEEGKTSVEILLLATFVVVEATEVPVCTALFTIVDIREDVSLPLASEVVVTGSFVLIVVVDVVSGALVVVLTEGGAAATSLTAISEQP